jgi:hypothetical protein
MAVIFNPSTISALARIGSGVSKANKGGKLSKIASGTATTARVASRTSLLGGLGLGMVLPLVGAVGSLMGGAMSLAGGVLTAGSTIAGIAGNAAGGVLGAVGGLAGGGQSGAVDKSATEIVPFGAQKTPTSPGSGLMNIKSALPAITGDVDGEMSMLPTGEESETTLLGQILIQTRANTMLLGSILGALTTNLIQTRINNEKEKKGDGKEPGIVKRTFSALGNRLKDLSSGLGSTAKSMLKGAGIVALLMLFKKYRTQISSVVANIFETLEGWYQAFQDGGNPITDMFERVRVYFDTEVLPVIKGVIISMMEMVYTAVATIINALLPDFLPKLPTQIDFSGVFGDPEEPTGMTNANSNTISYDSSVDTSLQSQSPTGTIKRNIGLQLNSDGSLPDINQIDYDIDGENSAAVQELIKQRLNMMYNNFNNSRGRIQWTGVGKGFELDQGVNSLFDNNVSLDISKILNSKPLVDGYEREMNDLNNPNLLLLPFDKNSPFRDEFVNSLIASSTRKQAILASTTSNPFLSPFRGEDGLKFSQNMLNEQRLVQERLLEKAAAITVVDGKTTHQYNSKTENHMQSGVQDTNLDLTWHWGGALKQAQ